MTPAFASKVEESGRGVLSCMRIDLLNVGAACILAGVSAKHFLPPMDTVYAAMIELWRENKPYDFIGVCSKLRATGSMEAFASSNDVRALLYEAVAPAMAPDYIRLILECHAARTIHTLGQSLVNDAFNLSLPIADTLDHARQSLQTMFVDPTTQDTSLQAHLSDAMRALKSEDDNDRSIPFGLGLDELAGPFNRGDLIVIGAETKKGKSAIAGNIVENVAKRGLRAAIFSLEMTTRQNAERMIASQARVDVRAFKLQKKAGPTLWNGQQADLDRMERAVKAMASWRVDIIPETFRLNQIVSRMIQLKSSGGLDLAVIDYTQLVEGARSQGDNREREVASISRLLKRAAVQTDSTVILLSQLNDEGRLRESRAIGQDANCVLFLEENGDEKERVVRVGAARSAPTGGEINLQWEQEFTRFSAAQ